MSKRQLLEYANGHNAKIYSEIPDDVVVCRCRFGHKFLISSLDEWCHICKSDEFLQQLIAETRVEVESVTDGLQLLKVDCYGGVTLLCQVNHLLLCDIDDIPDSCNYCKDETKDYTDIIFDIPDDSDEVDKVDEIYDADIQYDSDEIDDFDIIENLFEEEYDISQYQQHNNMMISDIIDAWVDTSTDTQIKEKPIDRKYRESNLEYILRAPEFAEPAIEA